jgi:tight adherence protein B
VIEPIVIAADVALCGVLWSAARASVEADRVFAGVLPVRAAIPQRRRGGDRTRVHVAIGVAAAAAIGGVVLGVPGVALGVAACVAAGAMRRRRRSKGRAELLEAQLADAVGAIAAALRAGLSLSQALAYAAQETEAPLGETLRRASGREALGEPLEAALDRWADEVGTDDARLVNGVLALHRRTGGDLPRVLDRVADTLRDRRETAREVRALTAQARLSGAILGLLPIGFFGFLLLTSRRDIAAAFETPVGVAAVGLGLGMQGAAFVWIRRLLRVG